MTQMPPPTEMQRSPRGTFVQTEREAHTEWARLSVKRPAASAVLHYLAANVGTSNGVVISQKALGKALGVTDRTIRTALGDLEARRWIQIVRLGAGRECAYILNDKVVWADKRDNLRFSRFTAQVIADADEQSELTLSQSALYRLPEL